VRIVLGAASISHRRYSLDKGRGVSGLLKVSPGFCFQLGFEQNFFGKSASFAAIPLGSIDAAKRPSNFLVGQSSRSVVTRTRPACRFPESLSIR
jgi:hypothetical protein